MYGGTNIAMLRAMIGPEDDTSDEVLSVYLDLAAAKILGRLYPYKSVHGHDLPEKYVATQLNIACYLLNKRGAEGQVQHIENGIHRNYGSADVPEEMLRDIVPFAQAIR